MALPFNLDSFVESYIGTLVWATHDIDDGTTIEDFNPLAVQRIRCLCEFFLWKAYPYLEAIDADPDHSDTQRGGLYEYAAHDLCLTSNGHGAGFWDGGWPIYGGMFTKLSEAIGGVEPYIGDDGKIYL